MDESPWEEIRFPAIAATVVALYFASRFRQYLPITDAWATIETALLPLTALDVAFHEAGHLLLGLFGWEFLRIAGGTIFQLAIPAACLLHFVSQRSRAGVGFCAFWIGKNLVNISFYAADAQSQSLILITGMSGREGGFHDWGHMLTQLGLWRRCVGIGQGIFFAGVWLMVFALAWFLVLTRRRLHKSY